ncbi:MAG: hypothetical protein A2X40_05060 [Elusimicrobia bacterium GWC2_65_9]|nr:MAG: hypothetical protein A2X40_05060 [Elusimicrobia bacterium GWC2_65_9]
MIVVLGVAGVLVPAQGAQRLEAGGSEKTFSSNLQAIRGWSMGRLREGLPRFGFSSPPETKSARPVLFDFGDGRGAVPAHPHSRGGGWVADSAKVAFIVWVERDAVVCGMADVSGHVRLLGRARACGNARISGNDVIISGDAVIEEDAEVSDSARIEGQAVISGRAIIASRYLSWPAGGAGTPRVSGHARVHGNAVVCGNAMVSGSADVRGTAYLGGHAWVEAGEIVRGAILDRNLR